MAKPITEEALEELREYIQQAIAGGFKPVEEIAESAVEILDGEYEAEDLRIHAAKLTEELLAAHRQEQASWPAVTDCDRLDAAFAQLEATGVVCRQDFSCCGNCGAGEIRDEMEAAAKGGLKVRGYAFYHMQDTESAVEGGGVYLNYGSAERGEAAALEIAREISSVLQQHGLTVHWNGLLRERVLVKMTWQRRRALTILG